MSPTPSPLFVRCPHATALLTTGCGQRKYRNNLFKSLADKTKTDLTEYYLKFALDN